MMEFFHTLFDWYMSNLNYFTIALLMAIESTFLSFTFGGSDPLLLHIRPVRANLMYFL